MNIRFGRELAAERIGACVSVPGAVNPASGHSGADPLGYVVLDFLADVQVGQSLADHRFLGSLEVAGQLDEVGIPLGVECSATGSYRHTLEHEHGYRQAPSLVHLP